MPTYDFTCPRGHEFEKFYSKISDASSEVPCPECGETAVRQISAGAGLLFKGSGFYLTDYGRNAHRGDAKKPAEGGGSSGEKSVDSRSGDAKSGDAKPSGGSGAAKSDSPNAAGKSSESKPAAAKADAPKKKSE